MSCCGMEKEIDLKKYNYNAQNHENARYYKKRYMTYNESKFYNKLVNIFNDKFIVVAQVQLSSVIKKTSGEARTYQNELYRTIDFALIDKNDLEPMLLIELNDNTHNQKNRQSRDIKVKELCEKANLKLITFWDNYPNEENYLKERINKELNR